MFVSSFPHILFLLPYPLLSIRTNDNIARFICPMQRCCCSFNLIKLRRNINVYTKCRSKKNTSEKKCATNTTSIQYQRGVAQEDWPQCEEKYVKRHRQTQFRVDRRKWIVCSRLRFHIFISRRLNSLTHVRSRSLTRIDKISEGFAVYTFYCFYSTTQRCTGTGRRPWRCN